MNDPQPGMDSRLRENDGRGRGTAQANIPSGLRERGTSVTSIFSVRFM